MVPRGWRDIQIQNTQVREVHAIDTHQFVEFYDIAEWKDLMLVAGMSKWMSYGKIYRLDVCFVQMSALGLSY